MIKKLEFTIDEVIAIIQNQPEIPVKTSKDIKNWNECLPKLKKVLGVKTVDDKKLLDFCRIVMRATKATLIEKFEKKIDDAL